MDFPDWAPTNKCPSATGGSGSSPISFAGILNQSDGAHRSKVGKEMETKDEFDTFDPGGTLRVCRSEKREKPRGNQIGGRFWVLEQSDDEEEKEVVSEDVQRSPYLATIADAFACAKRGRSRKSRGAKIGKENEDRESALVKPCNNSAKKLPVKRRMQGTDRYRNTDFPHVHCKFVQNDRWFQVIQGKNVDAGVGLEPNWVLMGRGREGKIRLTRSLADFPLSIRSPARQEGEIGDDLKKNRGYSYFYSHYGPTGGGEQAGPWACNGESPHDLRVRVWLYILTRVRAWILPSS